MERYMLILPIRGSIICVHRHARTACSFGEASKAEPSSPLGGSSVRYQTKSPFPIYPACHFGGAQVMVMQQPKEAVSRNSVVACKKVGDTGNEKDTDD
jgi:hypothetical protein